MNVLFLCSKNRLRSPTAERIFQNLEGFDVQSAGLNHDSRNPLTPDVAQWADIIFVMEKAHRSRLLASFRDHLKDTRVVCLHIPDRYKLMDPALISLLETKVSRYLRL